MGRVTADISVSLDNYAAGPNQTRDKPFGDGEVERLHTWMFERGEENAAEVAGVTAAGAYIMGRNMFGPDRGEWDLGWEGWWGPEPPYHAPVFVLGHHPRETLEMEGGTVFNFVTEGIEAALERAREAAGDEDVAIAGGAATLNQYLAAGLVDELRLHVVPFTLGAGAQVFADTPALDLRPVSSRATEFVTHIVYRKPS